MIFNFNDKVVLVMGATSGIGRATAVAFAKAGASVVLVGRREAEGSEAVEAIQKTGGRALFIQADLAAGEQVIADVITRTVEAYGRLDAAFNNAGTQGTSGPIIDLTVSDWDTVFDLNVKSVWLACKHEFAQFQKQGEGGVIVNTSSFLSRSPVPGSSIYAASKGGVDALTRALAAEGGPHGIRVNAVNPGAVVTEMFRRTLDPDSEAAQPLKNAIPLRNRLGSGDDIAGAVLWLCSEASAYVTGQLITVDGGLTISSLG
ncbi:MAG TPA: glucose 1-dehydrogenase [Roseiflexaceae bacterium]|nr:glucose 1-dehydrogenase [Roseiflexaceae bacterium]